MDTIETTAPLAEQWAGQSEHEAESIRLNNDDPEAEWLAARLEAFARYLREEWARTDAEVLREQAELRGDNVLRLNESWWSTTADPEDQEHAGHGCSRDPEAPGYTA